LQLFGKSENYGESITFQTPITIQRIYNSFSVGENLHIPSDMVYDEINRILTLNIEYNPEYNPQAQQNVAQEEEQQQPNEESDNEEMPQQNIAQTDPQKNTEEQQINLIIPDFVQQQMPGIQNFLNNEQSTIFFTEPIPQITIPREIAATIMQQRNNNNEEKEESEQQQQKHDSSNNEGDDAQNVVECPICDNNEINQLDTQQNYENV
jgi:hypothetical protein